MTRSEAAGRLAIVTGAGSGIGRATCRRFLADGITVIGVDLDAGSLAETGGDHALLVPVVGNIADPGLVGRLAGHLDALGGRLDILVNCAARGGGRLAEDTSDDDLAAMLDVNVTAQFRLARFALSRMVPGGVIVNIGSMFGETGASAMAAYSISKAALSGMTRQLATDYGPRGIRVAAVAPGLIATPRTAARMAADDDLVANLVDRSALRRAGTAQDVASAVAFLASPEASYITGVILPVDGGWSIAGLPRRAGPDAVPA